MISKELLSEVLKYNVHSVLIDKPNIVEFDIGCRNLSTINIYELAHKCKEWARMNRYDLCSWVTFDKARCSVFNSYSSSWEDILTSFEADTEPSSIFKACQWILDNKDKE